MGHSSDVGRKAKPVTNRLTGLLVLALLTACGTSETTNDGFERAGDQTVLRLKSADPVGYELLGVSLAVAPGRTAVSSQGAAGEPGRVLLFEATSAGWRPTLEIEAPPEAGPVFGDALALEEEWLAVGASLAAGGGVVYLYGEANDPDPTVLVPSGEETTEFGTALDLDSGRLVVAGYGHGKPVVSVFELAGGEWRRASTLEAETGAGSITAVELNGEWLAVGQEGARDSEPGVVTIYREQSAGFERQAALAAPGDDDRYGAALALSGDALLVGSPNVYSPPFAYLFRFDGSWSLERRLEPPAGAAEHFGAAVALLSGAAAVGAPGADGRGAVHIFSSADDWSHSGSLRPSGTSTGDAFGAVLGGVESMLAVGATGDDDGGVNSGAVYIFPAIEGTTEGVGAR